MPDLKATIGKVAAGETLSREESRDAFDIIMSGEASPPQIAAFLTALRLRGETVDEIAGAVSTMRAKMTPVAAPADAIDVVGTGGDASGSYNISTTAAFVVAGAGVPVAKHGNRALTSKSGAADTLAALGVNIELTPDQIGACVRDAGIGFMFAPAHHAAMKHVGPVRAELGFRTIFNLIGPLSNPASVKRYLLGVYSPDWVEPLANVLGSLGAERAWVVHGDGGLDEISPSGETKVASLENGTVTVFTIRPEDADLSPSPVEAIKGGDAAHNAEALRQVLEGATGAYRDTVLLNAGAALVVAGLADDLAGGVAKAAEAIDTGKARERLDRLVAASNG
ncbi:anthranilate phosphoribosyltransferase [Bauldia litoralis]|uniref:Anthranilate phosphoribosyltransferase n=1 Tax=Bauldia litoralis TaxID=665467 RepID=A0A1G6AXL1_9HYPH|nr:anthranilate phosphoribosyltransferase [Bauldia litoralis]SDB13130.1 anthranilate phosphoribosyltransferase [Bauldia litoralis]